MSEFQVLKWILRRVVILSVILVPAASYALLGSKKGVRTGDAQALLSATQKVRETAFYSIYETKSEGYTLKEFVSKEGIVFGLAWKGQQPPDLNSLLGKTQRQAYQKTLKQNPRPRGRYLSSIRTGDIVVETGGHMRAVGGRAYLTSKIPQEISPSDVYY
jgi:hypothetical protein